MIFPKPLVACFICHYQVGVDGKCSDLSCGGALHQVHFINETDSRIRDEVLQQLRHFGLQPALELVVVTATPPIQIPPATRASLDRNSIVISVPGNDFQRPGQLAHEIYHACTQYTISHWADEMLAEHTRIEFLRQNQKLGQYLPVPRTKKQVFRTAITAALAKETEALGQPSHYRIGDYNFAPDRISSSGPLDNERDNFYARCRRLACEIEKMIGRETLMSLASMRDAKARPDVSRWLASFSSQGVRKLLELKGAL
jgi:hypothetical protein